MTTAPEKPAAEAPAQHPNVYQALARVMRDTTPVGKDQINNHHKYRFRGVDDLMSAVAGPMRTHGVFIVPELVERVATPKGSGANVVLTMRYRIFGPAGDHIEATVPGEASDTQDKATNKAMSAALKYLLLQVLMVPVDARSIDDSDRDERPDEPQQRPAEQQVRRGSRAEPGPWEQPQQPSAPSRDFLAEARAAATVAEVRALYAQAQKEEAPPKYLEQLAEIGAGKPAQAPQRPQGGAIPPSRSEREAAYASGDPEPHDRDYIAEARAAATADDVVPLYRAAEAAGAPADYLDQIKTIGTEKRAAAQQPQQAAQGALVDDRNAAVNAMYDAAEAAQLKPHEADDAFQAKYGCMPVDATTEQLRAQANELRAAMGGAK